jgi:hypothetical protein
LRVKWRSHFDGTADTYCYAYTDSHAHPYRSSESYRTIIRLWVIFRWS